MVAHLEPLSSGFPLTDINEDRYQYITSLRRRFGQFLHRASGSLLQQGEQNTLDAVMTLVRSSTIYSVRTANYAPLKIRSVRTYMLEYGDSRDRLIVPCYPNFGFLLIVSSVTSYRAINLSMREASRANTQIRKSGLGPSLCDGHGNLFPLLRQAYSYTRFMQLLSLCTLALELD
jgi:hypothetical protein